MWDLLLEKVPGFQPHRAAFLSEWQDDQQLPEYICTAELANFTIAALARGDERTVKDVLDVVECWIVDGDDDVSELAFVGVIEDLTNDHRHNTTRPEDFERFLSPRLRQEWDAMIRAWSGRT